MTEKTNPAGTLRILRVNSSARVEDSMTRALTDNVIDALEARYPKIEVIDRDLVDGMPFLQVAAA